MQYCVYNLPVSSFVFQVQIRLTHTLSHLGMFLLEYFLWLLDCSALILTITACAFFTKINFWGVSLYLEVRKCLLGIRFSLAAWFSCPGRLTGNSWWNWWQHYEVQSSGLVQESKILKKTKLCEQKFYIVPEGQMSFLELTLSASCQYWASCSFLSYTKHGMAMVLAVVWKYIQK